MPHFNSVNLFGISRVLSGLIYALVFACETRHDQLVFHLIYYFLTDIHLEQGYQCQIMQIFKDSEHLRS